MASYLKKNFNAYDYINPTKDYIVSWIPQFIKKLIRTEKSIFNFDDETYFKRVKELNNILFNDYRNNEEVRIIRSRGAWGNMVVDYSVYCDSMQFDLTRYLFKISKPVENRISKIRKIKN